MNEDVLELNALVPTRRQVPLRWPDNPDGELVELAEPEDFGMLQLRELYKLRDEWNRLADRAKLTKAQEKRLVVVRDRMLRMLILGGPDKALDLLPDFTKAQVIGRFFVRADLGTAEFVGEETVSRMERLSRDFSGSTEETQNAG